jgi:Na+/H+ antiporter NhaD/arsenite permease-like protein
MTGLLSDTTLAVLIFAVTFVVLVTERVHRTTAALAGAVTMIAAGIEGYGQESAFQAIDLNVIFLLVGMMIIVNMLARTGLFQWLSVRSAKLVKGNGLGVMVMLSLVTAFASAFLDNVTTVILLAPVTLILADTLEIRAAPILIAQALASNIGGAATLVGDPPNILIASGGGLSFAQFAANMAPLSIISLAAGLATLALLAGPALHVSASAREGVLELNESGLIADQALLYRALFVLGLTIVGFILHSALGLEPATIALAGAALLLLVTREDPHQILRDVEWTTILFFAGLFVVVGGLEHTGVLVDIADAINDLSGGRIEVASMLLLWVSALLSGIVDNIPYTTALIPVVAQLKEDLHAGNVVWWSLAIGADFGGNFTIIGASANVLVANLASRGGSRISFGEFFRYGAPVTVVTMVIATGYVWLRYLM